LLRLRGHGGESPSEYQFLTELADAPVNCISIETAQSSLDCSVWRN